MEQLGWNEINSAIRILSRCEEWTKSNDFGLFPGIRAITLNHLGCAHKKLGNV